MELSTGGCVPTGNTEPLPPFRETVIRAAISAIPTVGGPLEIIYTDVRARQAARLDAIVGDIVTETGEERLLRKIDEDPYLEALFVRAVSAATRTGIRAKQRLLSRAVATSVLDDAKLDESQLVVDALEELDVPQVLALARLADEWSQEQQRVGPEEPSWGLSSIWKTIAAPIRAGLVRTGTAENPPTMMTRRHGPNRQGGITDFGLQIVALLRSEGFADER